MATTETPILDGFTPPFTVSGRAVFDSESNLVLAVDADACAYEESLAIAADLVVVLNARKQVP